MVGCELTDSDEKVIAELRELAGVKSESELIRAAFRALLREQRRLRVASEGPKARTGTGG